MALQNAVRLGGEFLDLRELARNGPVLVVFRVREFLPAEPVAPTAGYTGLNVPVIADAWIVDGPRAGEVHLGEKFIGSVTAQLRGVKNPNAQKGIGVLAPVNAIGAEIVTRLKVTNPGRPNEGVLADPASESELRSIVEPAYVAMGQEQLWANAERNAAANAGALPPAAAPAQSSPAQSVPTTQLGQAQPPQQTPSVTQPAPAAADLSGLDPAQLQAMLAQLQAQQAEQAQPAPVGAANGAEGRPLWQQAQ